MAFDLELGDGDAKAVASARKELDAIRSRRAELEARIRAGEKRIAECEHNARRRLAELCKQQEEEIETAWKATLSANNQRWPELAKDIDERVASETALRTAALAAIERASETARAVGENGVAPQKANEA